jgi:Fe-S cluster biogenesis protein NfuA/nitrite reductase/ring-hydroxylating ferredoxin subunit
VVQALLELYGAGLERIVDEVAARDDGQLAEALAADDLVAHLLLLHGLHPVALEARVRQGLDEVRPYLESHGGDVELLGIDGAAVRLRLQGSCSGCPSSTMTLKLAIENAIRKAAPEIEEVIAEQPPSSPTPSLLQIEMLGPVSPSPKPDDGLQGSWLMAGGLPDLAEGAGATKRVGGQEVLFLKVQDRVYSYRPLCPACQASLSSARVQGQALTCPGCGDRYDVMRAGRGLDRPAQHLEPVPLLEGEDGLIKVALAMAP